MSIGLGRGAIERRLAVGRLDLVHRGVYTVGPILSGNGRYLAAGLACGEGAVASHRTAGAVLGSRPTATATVHVTVPTRSGRPRRSGIVVHRTEVLTPADVTTRDRIPVTSLPRTLIDLGSVLQPHQLARTVERAEALRVFDLRAVHAAIRARRSSPAGSTPTSARTRSTSSGRSSR